MPTQTLYGIALLPQTQICQAPVTTVINAANVGCATIFQPEDPATHGAVVGCLVYCTAISSPVALSYRASLQSITTRAAGPTGTVLGGGSPASKLFTPAVGLQSITFDNAFTVTAGTSYAIVIDSPSWASGSATFNSRAAMGAISNSPYMSAESGGTWTPNAGSASPGIAVVYNDGYISELTPVVGASGSATTAGTLYGQSFVPTMNMGFTGINIYSRPATGATITGYLYEGTSTAIASLTLRSTNTITVDPGIGIISGAFNAYLPMPAWELVAGNTYRMFFAQSSTPTTCIYTSFPSQALLQSINGPLVGCSAVGGTVTDYASGTDWRQYPMSPVVTYFLSSGGGGMIGSDSMDGGFGS